jgi:tripartite-type tricarboxylate transporter receptor subunit TctC
MKRCIMLLAFASAVPAAAQEFPARPIQLVTQFRAGASGSNTLRIFAEAFSKSIGQPVVVEDKAGGGGLVAVAHVGSSAPDGYTLFGGTAGPFTTVQYLSRNAKADANALLTPITKVGETTVLFGASSSAPFGTFAQMLEYAKQNPGKVTYGTSGIGSPHHLSGEEIQQLTGVKLRHVPYKASAAALVDTAAGTLMTTFSIYSVTLPHIKTGRIKPLAVVRAQRAKQLPDTPTLSEVLPGFEIPPSWVGLFAPAKTPKPVIDRLNAAAVKALNAPATEERLVAGGFDPQPSTPGELAKLIQSQSALVGRIVKQAGIQPH